MYLGAAVARCSRDDLETTAWREISGAASLRVSPVQPAPLELKLKRRGHDDLGCFLRRAIPSTLLRRHRPFRVRPAELPGLGMYNLHSCDSVRLTSAIFRRGYFHTSPAVYFLGSPEYWSMRFPIILGTAPFSPVSTPQSGRFT
jgi:hypothetical protein